MRRHHMSPSSVAACAAALSILLPATATVSARPPEQAHGARIAILASAVDASGSPVQDLKPTDLLAKVESSGATISGVSRVGAPAQIVVLVDSSSNPSRGPQKMVWNAQCVAALAEQLPTVKNFVVLGFSDHIAEIYSGPANASKIESAVKNAPRAGECALLEVMKYMGDTLMQQGNGDPTILVVVSDGVDTVSRASSKDVIRSVGMAGVPVYSLIVMDPSWSTQNLSKLNARGKLMDISKATGGTSISLNPGEVKKMAGTIGSLLDGRYMVEISGVTLKSNSESRLTLDSQRAGIQLYHADFLYNR